MSVKVGDIVIYIGKYDNRLVHGESYIVDYIFKYKTSIYYYLKNDHSYTFESIYFISLTEYRKQKLKKINDV